MIQSKGSKRWGKIEQSLNLGSLLLQRFCRVSTTYQAGRLIEVNDFEFTWHIFTQSLLIFLPVFFCVD